MKAKIQCVAGRSLPNKAQPSHNATEYGCDACEYIHDNTLTRCCKFIKIAGKTPDGHEIDLYKCSDAWVPILLVENSMTNRGQTAAIESLRNIVSLGQDKIDMRKKLNR